MNPVNLFIVSTTKRTWLNLYLTTNFGTDRTVAAPPKPRRSRYPGRRPLDDRALLTGILFILQTGLRWDLLSREMG